MRSFGTTRYHVGLIRTGYVVCLDVQLGPLFVNVVLRRPGEKVTFKRTAVRGWDDE